MIDPEGTTREELLFLLGYNMGVASRAKTNLQHVESPSAFLADLISDDEIEKASSYNKALGEFASSELAFLEENKIENIYAKE